MKFIFFVKMGVFLAPRMHHTFEKKIGHVPGSFQEEVKNIGLLTHNNDRKPIAIGHLSDSGDLKITFSEAS